MDLMLELKRRIDEADIWEREIELKRNDYLKFGGDIDTNLYFVEQGTLRIYITDQAEEHTIRFGYTGDFIAALDSFFTGKSSDYHIQAIKKCKLKVIRKETYHQFIRQNPENMELWQNLLKLLTLMHIEREKDILISSPQVRYKRVLERSPRLFQEIPNKYIASYLRMTPETLSRIKKY